MSDQEKNPKESEKIPEDFVSPRDSPSTKSAESQPAEEPESPEPEPTEPTGASRWQRFRRWYGSHKKLAIPLTILTCLLLLFAIPFTRYAIAGLFISHDVQVEVLDSNTGKPVSDAQVMAGSGTTGTTSGNGLATLRDVKAGPTTIKVSKKYYKDGQINATIGVMAPKSAIKASLEATGRQVKVKVLNTITQKALPAVEIAVADIKAKTDKSGEAVVVLPVGPKTQPAELKLTGYNDAKVTIKVSDTEIAENNFKLTPTGKIYFLSNRSGNLDVMKSNLDGSQPEVVLAGTGSENPNSTVLIASQDWKYLALLTNRGGTKPKVYVITTADDKLTTADEGSADFTLAGWRGSNLVYSLLRTDLKPWQTGAGKLKSYDANTGKLTTLDQTTGSGDANSNIYEYYNLVFLSGDTVTYAKGWTTQSYGAADFSGKQETLSSISLGGQNHKVVASYDAATKSVDFSPHSPNAIYILTSTQGNDDYSYFDYEVGSTPKQISLTFDQFYKAYPTYYQSADDKKAVWTEQRDGKNAIIIGNSDGTNGKQIASLNAQEAFGWYGQQYVLLSKTASELSALGSGGGTPLQITSYQGGSYYATPPLTTY